MTDLSKIELLNLVNPVDEALKNLMLKASRIRDLRWGRSITYSRKVFVPLINMCRDRCGYCAFVQQPDSPKARLMSPMEVLKSLRAAEVLGCKEALFSLGDKPEARHPQAAEMLSLLGYKRTTDYLRDMCELTLTETSLIPHINAGVLDRDELISLQSVSGSMGMMLESLSLKLMRKGGPHYQCPDKSPKLRLKTLRLAGQLKIPFTTGLLIGIGETWEDRIAALRAIEQAHQEYGHIQEVIIQNFRAKPDTAMASAQEPDMNDILRTLGTARVILDPSISLQAPPNLAREYLTYLKAGINDFGGISPISLDYINPERAWPALNKLKSRVEQKGFQLQERLTVYPQYLRNKEFGLPSMVRARLRQHAREDGLSRIQLY